MVSFKLPLLYPREGIPVRTVQWISHGAGNGNLKSRGILYVEGCEPRSAQPTDWAVPLLRSFVSRRG